MLSVRVLFLVASVVIGFFFDGRNENRFACFVPSFAFALNGDGCFMASTYHGFTKSVIGHGARGKFKEVFVVEFALFVFFTYLPPVNFPAIKDGRFSCIQTAR